MTKHPLNFGEEAARATWPADFAGDKDALNIFIDLGAVDAKNKPRAVKAWIQALPQLHGVRRLNFWSRVSQPMFEAICQMPQLEVLIIKWSAIVDLTPLTQLRELRHFQLGNSSKIISLEPLARLHDLQTLYFGGLPKCSDFSPLAELHALRELHITGDQSAQRIDDLTPLAQLHALKDLSLRHCKLPSLRPLAALTSLRELGLFGNNPLDEIAWLSVQLPNTECMQFQPYLAYDWAGMCTRCYHAQLVDLVGKGARQGLCPSCDAAVIAPHAQAFADAQQLARDELAGKGSAQTAQA